MKATIEIPDALYRRVKAQAALRGVAVREVTTELYSRWLSEGSEPASSQTSEEWLDEWERLGAELLGDAPEGPTATEIISADRARLDASDTASQTVMRACAIVGEALVGVVVFGSWARGTATDASDVDILIVTGADMAVTRGLYREWDAAPLEWEGRPIEPHFVGLPEPHGRLTGLWAEVATDGLVLYERGFAMSRRLAEIRGRIADGEMVRRWSNGHPYWISQVSQVEGIAQS